MRFLEKQIDRAFRHGTDGRVIFQPLWGTAYLVPSAERETRLRYGFRRFTIAAWLFALGCPFLSVSGRLAAASLWSSTGSLAVLKASLFVRLAVTLFYFVAGTWWLWRSLRDLTSDLQPAPAFWVPPEWIRGVAQGATRTGLLFMAVAGGLLGVGSVIVLLSFRFLDRSETLVVASLGVLGLVSFLWCRVLMFVKEQALPNKAVQPTRACGPRG